MHLLKRSIVFQIALFTFFIFFGVNYILREIIQVNTLYTIVQIAFLSMVAIGGVICVIRTKKDDYVIVDKPLLNFVKFALYGLAAGLMIGLISSFFQDFQAYFLIIAGAVISLSSLFGLYISIKIISIEEDHKD